MRLPTTARTIAALSSIITAGTLLLSACSADVASVAPAAAPAITHIEASSSFVPTAAQRALVGVLDGTYAVTFDPTLDQSFSLGPNHLDIPAYSVCNMLFSGYGPNTWNSSCSRQVLPVALTIVIKNASSSHPSIQFFPAMRFSPDKQVRLFMYAPNVSRDDAKNWQMLYCNDSKVCVDESLTDQSLATNIDYVNNVLFRRVKHFSGYVVAENSDGGNGGDGGLMQP